MSIHPTAIIGKQVELDRDVTIGPYAVISGRTRIGKGTQIDAHVSIGSETCITHIGLNNIILSGAKIGGPPQDLSYKGEPTQLIVGDNNNIREFVTMNCGTLKGGGITRVGNNNMFMAYVHVAHDCDIKDHVVIANLTQLAGHVVLENYARLGGMCGLAQFVRVGKYAYVGGGAHINKDILPFCIAEGNWARARATNKIGLQRAGFSKEEVENIHRGIKCLIMGDRTIQEALDKMNADCESSENIKYMIDFISKSETGIAR